MTRTRIFRSFAASPKIFSPAAGGFTAFSSGRCIRRRRPSVRKEGWVGLRRRPPSPFPSMPPDHSSEDVELFRRIADGDASAFAAVYDRYATFVHSVALKVLADPEEARDVLQQVFLTLHEKADRYDPALGAPPAWLSTLARNRALDRVRARKTRQQCLDRLCEETEAECRTRPEPILLADEIFRLRAAVRELPTEQRSALELAYFGGLTQQEIADKLAEPLGTVKARIRRGLLKLREALAETFQ